MVTILRDGDDVCNEVSECILLLFDDGVGNVVVAVLYNCITLTIFDNK